MGTRRRSSAVEGSLHDLRKLDDGTNEIVPATLRIVVIPLVNQPVLLELALLTRYIIVTAVHLHRGHDSDHPREIDESPERWPNDAIPVNVRQSVFLEPCLFSRKLGRVSLTPRGGQPDDCARHRRSPEPCSEDLHAYYCEQRRLGRHHV